MKRILIIFGKTLLSIILIAWLLVLVSSVSLVYDYPETKPFSGPDIFNPYREVDSLPNWKRANFHTHTKVSGPLNECKYNPAETDEAYRKLGYDIVTFSNHNELTKHPYDPKLQVNVYEHGYNILKFHKLVFGANEVNLFDNLAPVFGFQKQFQIDKLAQDADFIQLNHPVRTFCLPKSQMQQLEGYKITELDTGMTTENEFWDWSLSNGHYSFGLANDDLHYPDRSYKIALRSNFLSTPSATYDDLKKVLMTGGYYSMRTPDYGDGDWNVKYASNRNIPKVKSVGLDNNTVFMTVTQTTDSIKVTGQDHKTLAKTIGTDSIRYTLKANDPYARITAYFPTGEVIYSNPFARYDASKADSPFRDPAHTVNIPLTILYLLLLLILCAADYYLLYLLLRKRTPHTRQ